jgi:copper chaperone CopZ
MESKAFVAPNISCGHCVRTIERELAEVPGVVKVHADQNSREVTVQWDPPATWEQISALMAEIGYPVAA